MGLRVRSRYARMDAWGEAAMSREIVGRDAELVELERFLDVVRGGPAVFVLEGAAGIGKTTVR